MSETSTMQQLMMNNMEMNSQIMQGTFGVISELGNSQKNNTSSIASFTVTNNQGKLAYAVEGDSKYKAEIDSNDDGIITYNEYVKYVTENMSSKYNIPKNNTTYSYSQDSNSSYLKFSVNNIGKILSSYLKNYSQLPSGIIEKEA